MQLHRPDAAGGEQRVGKRILPVGGEQSGGEPHRFVAENVVPGLGDIGRPVDVVARRARAV
jgi:hypothetical protein